MPSKVCLQQARNHLLSLGEGADEIADSLRALGIKGERATYTNRSPISQFLRAKMNVPDVSVGRAYISFSKPFSTAFDALYLSMGQSRMKGLLEFICKHDINHYPDLVDHA